MFDIHCKATPTMDSGLTSLTVELLVTFEYLVEKAYYGETSDTHYTCQES